MTTATASQSGSLQATRRVLSGAARSCETAASGPFERSGRTAACRGLLRLRPDEQSPCGSNTRLHTGSKRRPALSVLIECADRPRALQRVARRYEEETRAERWSKRSRSFRSNLAVRRDRAWERGSV